MSLKSASSIAKGQYMLIEKIGEGGMGEVWKARKQGIEGFQKDIVLKVMNAKLDQVHGRVQFLNEARLVAQLHHPNIVEIYDLGQDGELDYIAMELIEGKDLQYLLESHKKNVNGPIPWDLAAYIISKVCIGLHYAHHKTDAQGKPLDLVHRDLKPGNILISEEGFVKVIDFGIAKSMLNEGKTQTGTVKGTPAYMAPEQILGQSVDQRSDIFALGTILYELCCGYRPFAGETLYTLMYSSLSEEPPSPREYIKELPIALERCILKAMEKQPSNRYQTAREFQKALESFLRNECEPLDHENVSEFYRSLMVFAPLPEADSSGPDAALAMTKSASVPVDIGVLGRSQAGPLETQKGAQMLRQGGGATLTPQGAWPVASIEVTPTATSTANQGEPRVSKALLALLASLMVLLSLALWRPWSSHQQSKSLAHNSAHPKSHPRLPARLPSPKARARRTVGVAIQTKRPPKEKPKQVREVPRVFRPLVQKRRVAIRRSLRPQMARLQLDIRPSCILFKGSRRLAKSRGAYRLDPGRHRLRCVNFAQRFVLRMTLRLMPGRTFRLRRQMQRGKFRVLSFPHDATFGLLYSQGQILGPLPGESQRTLSLYEGRYELILHSKKDHKKRKRIRFVIHPGQTVFPKAIWK